MYKKINETSKFINKFINNESIHSAIILGSGMSGFDENFKSEFSIDYSEIPNFIKPSVPVLIKSLLNSSLPAFNLSIKSFFK